MTPTTPGQLALYRRKHLIAPNPLTLHHWVCDKDGIRLVPKKGGWRHDPDEVKALAAIERGES